jgi:epoxyqueuosine reductase
VAHEPPDAGTAVAASIGALQDEVLAAGLAAGLDQMGVASAGLLQPARAVLPLRKAAGLAASMQFTYRNPDRSTDPQRVLPDAAAIVAGARGYQRRLVDSPPTPVGRVARYAWRDHYRDLRHGLEASAAVLRAAGWEARVHADDNNLVDRNVAVNAGLGWYGKNANVLLPGLGSWYVLGGVVTNAPLNVAKAPLADGCGSCRRCIDGCPTDAIVGPGIIDARRCLAWLVQGPGSIPVEFRDAVGDRLYGCDDCQDVCPPNRAIEATVEAEADSDPWIELEFVLTASDAELLDRIGRWYIADRDPDVVRRTALVVLGNIGDPNDDRTVSLLSPYLQHTSAVLREHAEWAAAKLGLAG